VRALKFLGEGHVAPFTGLRWPVGEWVEARAVDPCREGVHALRARDLPYWLGRELWEIELDGEIVEQDRKVVASRGRLVRRIDAWTPALLDTFADDLLRRTKLRVGHIASVGGYVGDIARYRAQRRYGLAAFAAARAAEVSGGAADYDRERRRQAEWLAARLALEPTDERRR
jgi:hypothetical protein